MRTGLSNWRIRGPRSVLAILLAVPVGLGAQARGVSSDSATVRNEIERLWGDRASAAWLDARLTEVERGGVTPFAVADELLERSGELLTQPTPAGVRRGEP